MSSKYFKIAILCEHIVYDLNNKYSLIGVYSDNLTVAEIPAHLRFGLYVVFIPDRDGDHTIEITFSLNDNEIAKGQIQIPNTTMKKPVQFALPTFDMTINQDSQLKIDAIVNDGKSIILVNNKIAKGEITGPSGFLQLSEQSPAAS